MTTRDPDFIFFESELPNLLREHRGQFAIIKEKKIHGFYSSFEDALKQGYEKFGDMNFLIQEITDEKRVNYIKFHSVPPCQSLKYGLSKESNQKTYTGEYVMEMPEIYWMMVVALIVTVAHFIFK